MTGIKKLDKLLQNIAPKLHQTEYVFCTIPSAQYGDWANLNPIASFVETEGLTLIVPKQKADTHQIPYNGIFKAITLTVHSSLEAVGLTAAFATKLAEHGISANVVAGYHHDHIFIPLAMAQKAVNALKELANSHPISKIETPADTE